MESKAKKMGRMKYCVVESCEYFKGTDEAIKMFRCPKYPEVAKVWLSAIGAKESDGIVWSICEKHFEKSDLVGQSKIRLKAGAIPSINLYERDSTEAVITVSEKSLENFRIFEKNNNNNLLVETLEIHDQNPSESCQREIPNTSVFCEQCFLNESTIMKYEKRISELEKLLKKHMNKTQYLERSKKKISTHLLSVKKQQMRYAEQYKLLEVHKFLFFTFKITIMCGNLFVCRMARILYNKKD